MTPFKRTDQVSESASTHALLLFGSFITGFPVLVRCRMALDASNGVTLEVTVRSANYEISELIANSVC